MVFLLGLTLLTSSCSSYRQRFLINTIAPVLERASLSFEEEESWERFKMSAPGQIKFLEGLLKATPDHPLLLVMATKAHATYAFAVHETLALKEKLKGAPPGPHHRHAISSYTKALHYGLHFLSLKGAPYSSLSRALRRPGGLPAFLDDLLPQKDLSYRGAFFTAMAMMGTIHLQKNNITLMAQLPTAQGLFKWACSQDPSLAHGSCGLFQASLLASRPRLLGGDPPKAKALFENLIQKHPHHWLLRVAYLEHYVLPRSDRTLYKAQKTKLVQFHRLFEQKKNWDPTADPHPAFANKALHLSKAIALHRFAIIQSYESTLF